MKSAFLLLLIVTATPSAFGQASSPSESVGVCNLTFAQAPAIRGLKLGMSLNEVLALFPGSSEDDYVKRQLSNAKEPLPPTFNPGGEAYGLASLGVPPPLSQNNPKFTGISSISLTFFDEKLVSLYLSYSTMIWHNSDEMLTKLIEAYRLPSAGAWSGNSQTNRELLCKDFSLNIHASVGSVGNSQLVLNLLKPGWNVIHRQQQERRTAAILKAQRDFKP